MRIHRLIAVAMFGFLCGCANGDGNESFEDKREWSILQSIEFKQRGNIPERPEFTTVEGYELLSVPSLDKSERIWIMLWPKSPPFYKQMPEGNFEIPQEVLLQLLREYRASSTVWEALRSHVPARPNHAPQRDARGDVARAPEL